MELAVLEVYNSSLHGEDELNGTYIMNYTVDVEEFLQDEMRSHQGMLHYLYQRYIQHSDVHVSYPFRSYAQLVTNINTYAVRIVQRYVTESNTILAVDKTYALNILKRKWRKYIRDRNAMVKRRSNPRELYLRRITGKWLR